METKEPILCYVCGQWAFFTDAPLSVQWGDDWNDAPYEHNAGYPYERDSTITRVAFHGEFETPADIAGRNSRLSVEDINAGVSPWLIHGRYGKSGTSTLAAGATLSEFCKWVKEHGGSVYMKS